MDEINGIINIYKEQGFTSHDVVAKLRGILHTRKIGHTGTLDPMAEGILPVCVGKATKLCDMITDHDKEYEAVMILGKKYDTLDVTGDLLEEREVMSTEEDIRAAISSFIGGYDQIPPMYSAKKVDGRKLYDLARSGVTVERKSSFVRIDDIRILSVDIPRVTIEVSCGRGTYIRSLIDDIGEKLSCGAAMEKLTRTRVGDFTKESALTLAGVEKAMADGTISDVIISLESCFSHLASVRTDEIASKLLKNGNTVSGRTIRHLAPALKDVSDGTKVSMYDDTGVFTGVYEYKKTGDIYKPFKMFLG